MGIEFPTVRARFGLRLRCANCRLVMCRELASPDLADAPADVEELLESNLLSGQFYPCEECDNPIATLIGVKQLEAGEVFETAAPEGDGPERVARPRVPGSVLPAARRRGLGERVGRPSY